jgi:hypothetical protein
MRETGRALARLGGRDIDVVRRPEVLGLRALLNLEIKKRKLAAAAQPSVINEE